jgi:LL-diaminopimelate aminotransferase
MARRLPAAGENLFQRIKRIRNDYEQQSGRASVNLSVGEPDGIPTEVARSAAAVACLSTEQSTHVYQDNGEPEGFSNVLVGHHVSSEILERDDLDVLPLPGIKPMIGLLPLACGANRDDQPPVMVAGTTKPGYPVISTWTEYLGCEYSDWPLYSANQFRPQLSDAPFSSDAEANRLVLFNYPNNPTGATMSVEGWREICGWAVEKGVRLVNDAAYAGLLHAEHALLSDVAVEFPELEWIELFSASKSHNATGWRVGAAFGSADFIADLKMIKGNTDSGFAAPLAVGVMRSIEEDQEGLMAIRSTYATRIKVLVELLSPYLKLATEPNAGFFTFWHAPNEAFGEKFETADAYNTAMIERVGLVGVPYSGSDGQYIRYAVCFPVEESGVQDQIRAAMEQAGPVYT